MRARNNFTTKNMGIVRFHLMSAASVLALVAGTQFFPSPARAQDAAPIETVTVSATRVQRAGYSAPTPVTAVSAKDLEQLAPTTVSDVLAIIPSFRPDSTPQTSGVNSLGGGQLTANLRGLGSTRTLVLVNGKRFVPVSSDGNPDLTQIPTMLVSRVEVVTGGASAAYGSDAIAGVVNIILKDHIDGLQASFQYGESQYGDNIEEQASMAYGSTAFADKLTYSIGANYVNAQGILSQYTRPWGRKEVGLLTNSSFATNGLPNYIIAANDHTATSSNGGLITTAKTATGATSSALNGIAFDPNGGTHAFAFGSPVYGASMVGGEQQQPNPTLSSYLGKPFTALSSLAHGEYKFNENLKAFIDISASRTTAGGASQQPRDTALVINKDNAYIPASVSSMVALNNISTFNIGRYYDDTGPITLHTTNKTGRDIAGLEGTVFGDWYWDANFQYGENRYYLTFGPNNRNQANFRLASDAVMVTAANVGSSGKAVGSIACRTTLTAGNTSCMPVNVFGDGSETVNSYVNGSATYHLVTDQTVSDIDLNGTPFSTWAGPVSIATGMEYRREAGRAIADGVSTQVNADRSTGGWALGNQKNFSGAYNIYEGYLETVVPLLGKSDGGLPLLRNFDLNAAVRLTSYSTSGGVTTWKVGFSYQPIDDLHLRGTRSHDVRAPNLSELFQGGTGSSNTGVFDKVLNANVQVRQVGSGNLNLKPERSETWTGGGVYQPSWFPNFGISLDYYKITVAQVIASIGAPTLVLGCNAGNALYCQSVVFNANGTINYVNSPSLNLNSLHTSGVDIESSYNFPGDDIFDGLGGNFGLHLLATYVNELTTVLPGNVIQNTVGQVSSFNRLTGVPKWTGQGTISWDMEPFSVNLRARYVGAGVFSSTLHNGAGAVNTIANNDVNDRVYFGLGGSYNLPILGQPAQIFGSIDNIFNLAPASVPSQAAGGTNESSTNSTYYDVIGRLFKVGIRVSVN
jgi:iron complex outermembrane receptor protein